MINLRPIPYLSENSDELVPRSPIIFSIKNRNLDESDIDNRDTIVMQKRVEYRFKLLSD